MGPADESVTEQPRRRSKVVVIGIVLMGLSAALWVALLIIPFLPIPVGVKALIAGSQVIVAEVTFWLGAALAGPDTARRMRSWWRVSRSQKDGTQP